MDIKHVLSRNPLHPAYLPGAPEQTAIRTLRRPAGSSTPAGPVEIGYHGTGFAFDNEYPVHTVHLTPFGLADRPVTCGTGSRSSRTTATTGPSSGSRTAGRWSTRRIGRRRCTGHATRTTPSVHPIHPVGIAPGRSERARLPHQLLRGGRIRPLDRHALADRIRMGDDRTRAWRRRELPARRRAARRGPRTHGRPCRPTASSATLGSGRRALTRPIPVSGPPRVPSASTTGSSW